MTNETGPGKATEGAGSSSLKSADALVPLLGMLTVAALVFSLVVAAGGGGPSLIFTIIGVVAVGVAALVWKKRTVGLVASAVYSFVLLLLFWGSLVGNLTAFADYGSFITSIVALPVIIISILSSVIGLVHLRVKPHALQSSRRAPLSIVLALFTVGFVVGAIIVGGWANGAVLAIGKNANTQADITIVVGAANTGVAQPFSPANYTVAAGSTVTWVNKDTVTHTVTSTSVPTGAKPFDSGDLPYGNTFSVTLTVPGTYQYHCSIHPSMTGTVTVTAGG